MAEEPRKPAEQVVAVAEEPVAEKPVASTEEGVEAEKPKKDVVPVEPEEKISQSVSFKEESNVVGELPEAQKQALEELKNLIQDALNKHDFTVTSAPAKEEGKPAQVEAEQTETEKAETVTSAVPDEEKKGEAEAVKKEEEEEKPASEEPKIEEKAETEKAETVTSAVPYEAKKEEKADSEEPKIEEKAETKAVTSAARDEEKKEEEEKAEAVVVTEVVEKVADVDDDGAKTVEAIEESIVSVSTIEKTEEEAAPPPSATVDEVAPAEHIAPEEVSIWGIPLLADERSDVILLKFLRARDFKVKEAFTMIKNTVRWRKEFGIDDLVEEDLGNDWDKVVFTNGYDKKGHPVCYNVFGEFADKELYQNTFSDEEKRQKFIRWRIQFLEKSVRKFDFTPTGVSTIFQVNDLKNSPGLLISKKELRQSTNRAVQLLQDNYPEFVAKQVFINVPWWYLAFSRMISPFLTQRTKSKFVFAGPSKSAEALFKYIAPEQVPVQYGGLSREGDQEFSSSDAVTEVTIKPATKYAVELPVSEASHVVWEVRVVGWDVSYGAEFVPSADDGYTVIVQKGRKIAPTDETVISNSFKVGEPGKVVLTIDNQTSKKKKLLYRSKTKLISG